jgi:hypothetical protein
LSSIRRSGRLNLPERDAGRRGRPR